MDENTLTSPTGDSPFGLRSSLFLASLVFFSFFISPGPSLLGFSSLFDSLLHRACNYLDNCHPFLFFFCLPQLLFITSTAIAIDPAYCR